MKLKQIRYYGDGNGNNYPAGLTAQILTTENVFTMAKCKSIIKLGIQGRANTKFYLSDKDYFPIVLGETGIYEIDLEGRGTIDILRFVKDSAFDQYSSTGDVLLVDIIYEEEG